MAILGLILLAAAAVAGVELGLSNRGSLTGEAFGYTATASPAAFLLAGVALTLVALLGLWMITHTARRGRHRRMAAQTEVQEARRTTEELARENEMLRDQLDNDRRQQLTMGGVAVPPGAGDVPYGDQISDAVRSESVSQTGQYEPYPADQRHGVRSPEQQPR